MEWLVHNKKDLKNVALSLKDQICKQRIVLLFGEMGVGKTTFVKSILETLGSGDLITSPTFSLVNEYHADIGKIYHMDMYRLNSLNEALDIGIQEMLDSNAVCLIEWPKLILDLVPENALRVYLEIESGFTRKIIV